MVKIVIAGNCQAVPLKRAIEISVSGQADVKAYTIHNATPEIALQYEQDVYDSDIVFSFSIAESFRLKQFTPSNIQNLAGDKLSTITNLYFSGYHPDFSYINKVSNNSRVIGYLGDYHSKICLVGCLLNCSDRSIADAMNNKELGSELGYDEVFDKSMNELLARDKSIDIGYAKRFAEIANTSEHFLTFNHPKNNVFFDYVYMLLRERGVTHSYVYPYHIPEFLGNGPILSSHPSCTWQKVRSKRQYVKAAQMNKFVDENELIIESRKIYNKLRPEDVEEILNLPWARAIVDYFKCLNNV